MERAEENERHILTSPDFDNSSAPLFAFRLGDVWLLLYDVDISLDTKCRLCSVHGERAMSTQRRVAPAVEPCMQPFTDQQFGTAWSCRVQRHDNGQKSMQVTQNDIIS